MGLLLAALGLATALLLFQLVRHPETAVLLISLPNPSALACNIRCLGVPAFLQVLGETGKALFLVLLSFSFAYALIKAAARGLRASAFMERAMEHLVPREEIEGFALSSDVTFFRNPLPLAFTAGFLKPRIFLSTGLLGALDERELRAVVLHETRHQRAKDPLKGLLASFVSDFLFFLPASLFLEKTYSFTAEVAADSFAVDRRGDPLDLAAALLKVQKSGGLAASWFFDPTRERTRHLLGERVKIAWPVKRIVVSIILLATIAFLALVPVKRSLSSLFIEHDKTCLVRSSRH